MELQADEPTGHTKKEWAVLSKVKAKQISDK